MAIACRYDLRRCRVIVVGRRVFSRIHRLVDRYVLGDHRRVFVRLCRHEEHRIGIRLPCICRLDLVVGDCDHLSHIVIRLVRDFLRTLQFSLDEQNRSLDDRIVVDH